MFAKLEATLRRKDFAAVRNLDRKVFDVNEARHLYEGRIEDVNDIITALLREERLRVTHEGVSGGRKTFVLEPYTLLVYKKGLYLAGRSEGHGGEIRTFALDGFREVEWLRGETFDYPADFRPEQITEGAFGLIRGKEATRVRIRFDDKVARYVQRRMWHPTQRFRKVARRRRDDDGGARNDRGRRAGCSASATRRASWNRRNCATRSPRRRRAWRRPGPRDRRVRTLRPSLRAAQLEGKLGLVGRGGGRERPLGDRRLQAGIEGVKRRRTADVHGVRRGLTARPTARTLRLPFTSVSSRTRARW